ncbi:MULTISPECIES: 3,4-dihydroxy-2-butanone-4-phosphate synthase [unclassified Sphingobium]|uniref:3,4-dihydroxy-2-butanone-4-phosphate synthase n=1 Tax=unclassified Sphingobium TaxID=2611147 RepID=UPI0029CABDA8|nr:MULTISPECIES: 3,4-dihydroxy-2-butanone-4-phosphate synthase [unclassified Sphingobium]
MLEAEYPRPVVDGPLSPLSPIHELVGALRAGRPIILVDSEDRENEGDLVIAAEFATAAEINFMARYGRGLICLALTAARAEDLDLQPMVATNNAPHGTAFTVSIEAAEGVTTGISAHDRARTIAAAIDDKCGPPDLVSPGHIFPLVAQPGGVLTRPGHTEAAVDMARLAGLKPAGVICEILNDDGTMARLPDLIRFADRHGLCIGSIEDLIIHRRQTERQAA